jgi:hypothetical protein
VNVNTTRATTGATTLQYMTPNETRSMRASGCGEGCSKTPKRPGGARDTRDQSRGITQTGRYRFKISGPGGATRTGAGDCTPHTPVGGAIVAVPCADRGIYSEFYRGVRFFVETVQKHPCRGLLVSANTCTASCTRQAPRSCTSSCTAPVPLASPRSRLPWRFGSGC